MDKGTRRNWETKSGLCYISAQDPSGHMVDADEAYELTRLLQAWSAGDQSALETLAPRVEAELRRLARRYMSQEQQGHLLQTTALVNEAYLRLIDFRTVQWQDRAHFFGVSAQLMRRVLVDYARRGHFRKRGGGALRVSLDEAPDPRTETSWELMAICDAVDRLSAIDARKGQIVELRFFGGLSMKEISEVLKVSEKTVKRDWRMAQTWLYCRLSGKGDDDS